MILKLTPAVIALAKDTYGEIYDEFKAWEPDALVCTNGTISKEEIHRMRQSVVC